MHPVTYKIGSFEVTGDFVLVLLTLALIVLAIITQLFRALRRKPQPEEERLLELLSKPEIVDLLKSGNPSVNEILNAYSAKTAEPTSSGNAFSGLIHKITNDIEWDIAGLIGLIVTVVFVFMAVSGTISNLPEPFMTGWFMILGYYFGKNKK